jgi:hypothetical protein
MPTANQEPVENPESSGQDRESDETEKEDE